MKHVPNILTVSRVIFTILMLLFYKDGWVFAGLYSAAVVSDLLDGFIARRTNNQSRFGARLDSFADMLMYLTLMVLIFYWAGELLVPLIPWIVLIAMIRIGNFLITAYKYHAFAGLHTWSNKLTGALLVLTPIVYFTFKHGGFFWIVCLIALCSAVEETLIHLTSSTLNENRRSIFVER
ncbi:CDP-alcohol phosphatidyltransferase family protein [Sporolactobacillus sp. STCC-11]|jgi:CDP-diacylglycerol--glycerol-3-phosphate 3-phosphatidyltransferase|uniref:CDP-alcohol phosphatidyltransferase family protein n=1 Tax=Sporolactobacillus caesalpiniae TaxID=3230362 RepID=UPI0033984419